MDKKKILEILSKMNDANEVSGVSVGQNGNIELLDSDGNSLLGLDKQFEGLVFLDQHPSGPRKWRSWEAKKGKEF